MENRYEAAGYVVILLAVLLACKGKADPAAGSAQTATGETTLAAAPAPTVKPKAISAKDLARDYHANEVAADAKYKGRRVPVVGQIQSIDKDAFDTMIVRLATDNPFMSVMAAMRDDQLAAVSSLRKGQIAGLDCQGSGMVLGSPTLRECSVLLTDQDAAVSDGGSKR